MPWDPVRGYYEVDEQGNVITEPGGGMFLPGYNDQGNQFDAKAVLRAALEEIGMEALTDSVWSLQTTGAPQAQIDEWMQSTQEWKQRFAGNAARKAKGLSELAVGDYIRMEDQYKTVMRQYGVPEGLYDDPSDFVNYIGGNVSRDEFEKRVVDGYVWAIESDPVEKAMAKELYGLTDIELGMMAMDPDKSIPFFEARKRATEIAAQASRTGWGQLSADEAENLYRMDVTKAQAAEGFADLARWQPLYETAIGEAAASDISRQEQLAVGFGNDVQGRERLSRRARARANATQAGGGAVVTNAGATGLGSVS